MRPFFKIILLCLSPLAAIAQKDLTWKYITNLQADSLRNATKTESNDSMRMVAFRTLGFYYQEYKPDSSLYFHQQQLSSAKKLDLKLWQADACSQMGYVYTTLGNMMSAYESFTEAMELAENERNESSNWRPFTFSNAQNFHDARIAILAMNYQMMGNIWGELGETLKQKEYYWEAVKLGGSINNGKILFQAYSSLAGLYSPDSSIMFYKTALEKAAVADFKKVGNAYLKMAEPFYFKAEMDSAQTYINKSKETSLADNDLRTLSYYYYAMSYILQKGNKDSMIFNARKSLETAELTGVFVDILNGYQANAISYAAISKTDSAYKYEHLSYLLNDSLQDAKIASLTDYQKRSVKEQLRLKKLEEEKTAYGNRLKMIGLVTALAVILLVAIILYRNNYQKQKANSNLQEQKEKVENTLLELRSTQQQLIQSEKMASLGELTAGIAHEIQNPLNFVNNFSEVNAELITELVEEVDKGNTEEVKAIAKDIKDNEEKINHHGKRADAIVKGMLQHSRTTSATKELTDINKLADEYLRLAYHGLRAKDKSFNVTLKTDFDESIGNVNIIPQDIGRVILNLITNAFYAVVERKKQNSNNYEPTVTVSTSQTPPLGGRGVWITVTDNGSGIPSSIKDKIFQPFFTTKPTGHGTGLGLSLAYDIVKAHGGELTVDSEEHKGSVFIISLPQTLQS